MNSRVRIVSFRRCVCEAPTLLSRCDSVKVNDFNTLFKKVYGQYGRTCFVDFEE